MSCQRPETESEPLSERKLQSDCGVQQNGYDNDHHSNSDNKNSNSYLNRLMMSLVRAGQGMSQRCMPACTSPSAFLHMFDDAGSIYFEICMSHLLELCHRSSVAL